MSKIKKSLVSSILPIIKVVGKIEMEKVLSSFKERQSQEIYRNTLLAIHSNFVLLKEAAIRTSTRIDDGIIELILESVKETAKADGIELS